METRILAHVENMESHLVQTVRELVAINTINPYSGDPQAVGEWAGQQHLRPRLEALGAQITLFEPPPDIYERMGVLGPLNRDFTDRPNLVAEISYGASGPTIILNGHMDTVGAQEMVCNPFAGEVHDGAIWGRGPTDCKGGLAVGLCALEALRDLGLEMKGRVIFESVVDEECNGSGAGTMACVEAGYRGDMAIFLDGNDGTMTLGCYGCLTADIHVTGQEGHAAYGTGVSALEKALIAKEAVDAFAKARLAKQQNCRTNIGIFEAGVHPAVVPGRAYMSLNMVYTYHEALAAEAEGYPFGGGPIREVFEQAIAQADRKDPWLREHPSRVEWIKDLLPFSISENTPAVQRLARTYRDLIGAPPEFNHMLGWSDACYYAHHAKMPTVLFGPGKSGYAHAPDEHVDIASLVNVCKVLAVFLWREMRAC